MNLGQIYRLVVDHSQEGIHIVQSGSIVFANQAAVDMVGYNQEELAAVPLTELIIEDDREEFLQYFKLWHEDKDKSGEYAFRVVRKGGECLSIEARFIRIQWDDQPATLFIFRDVSEKIKLERQLFLSQKLEAIGLLAGGIAHDFNNILTGIFGYAEMILMKYGSDEKLQEYAGEIKNNGERAASLIRQLLAFSRKQVLKPKVINLNHIVRGMHKMLKRLVGERVDIKTEFTANLGAVEADPTQIEQVIMNLVINARDAIPGGGNITIETANVELDDSYSNKDLTVRTGPYVMMAVSDDGQGIDEDTRPHIFEPFFSTKKGDNGTGLGLSTVYGIVKQSGGYIWVYSELGKWTTFKVYLPIVEKTIEKVEPIKVSSEIRKGRETILVIEDNVKLRNLAVAALSQYGYGVLEADNGAAALRINREYFGKIHLVVTDVVMPGINGTELAEFVHMERPGTKILFVSGDTEDIMLQQDILESDLSFLQKPFSPSGLARRVREVLDNQAYSVC